MKAKIALVCASLAAGTALAAYAAPAATLNADFSAPKTPVGKNLYGIFFEDINSSADGGIYAEMIQNRSFESKFGTEKWTAVTKTGRAKDRIRVKKADPLNENTPVYGELTAKAADTGIANSGYGGMTFEAGKTYNGSVYLRSPDGSISSVTVYADDGSFKKTVASAKISGITKEWKRFEYQLVSSAETDKGRLVLLADQAGTIDFDVVSLFPAQTYKNEPNGLRTDLAKKLEEMKPGFMRFPGGCVIEGRTLADAYRWKDTIGPVEERKENENFWGYHMSNGLGFYEYFRLCEDLGAEPVPVINCGMTFEGPTQQLVGMADIDEWVQDANDLIEFANGGVTTKWGKLRSDMGHPKPFNMKYLEIGNENLGNNYFTRYREFAEELRDTHPEIKLILGAGYKESGVEFDSAWSQASIMRNLVDLVDEHYYTTPEWFLTNTHRYDEYDRSGAKVYIGEFASQSEGKRNNMYAALSEAAYMTGIERNGDVIELASYAPLFAKDGSTQWIPDMIWFNNTQVYGTPDYYVQKMFMTKKSDRTVKYTLDIASAEKTKSYIGGTVGLGTWSTTAQFKDVKVVDDDTGKTVYDSNAGTIGDFDQQTGSWSQNGKTFVQTSSDVNVRAVLKNPGVNNYTYTLQAQKTGGMEGFLIMFGVNGKSLYWWNMGGWGNNVSCIEKGTADARSVVSDSKQLNLVAGQWYNIRIEVRGETISCYLDGQLMHTVQDIKSFDPVYAHIGETDDGRIIIKIVNIAEKPKDILINLNNAKALPKEGTATVLSGARDTENSFKEPEKIVPVTEIIKGIAPSFTYTAKAGSVTVIELISK
ncbi:MAG TPA: alpha-N-arabinofuranosidase [Treponema sp.]|nr:alpha-N-arabinofuranosidase [Treponema sp.]